MSKNQLVVSNDHARRMTSLQIAEIAGKRHSDVMRAIRKMEPAWEKVHRRKFALVDYTDEKGEKRPCYELTKEECLYIATKFNDEARAMLVKRWMDLERIVQDPDADELALKIGEVLLRDLAKGKYIPDKSIVLDDSDIALFRYVKSNMDEQMDTDPDESFYFSTDTAAKSLNLAPSEVEIIWRKLVRAGYIIERECGHNDKVFILAQCDL